MNLFSDIEEEIITLPGTEVELSLYQLSINALLSMRCCKAMTVQEVMDYYEVDHLTAVKVSKVANHMMLKLHQHLLNEI